MKDIVTDIAERAELDRDLTERAVTRIAAHLIQNGPRKVVATLRAQVPELDELAAAGRRRAEETSEPRAAGVLGRLGAATSGAALTAAVGAMLGGAKGGGVAKLMTLVGDLGQEGLGLGQSRRLTAAMIAHLRARAGDEVVDALIARMTAKAPFAARLLS